jgi:hypothetical protein
MQVEHPLSENLKSEMLQYPRLSEHWHAAISGTFHTLPLMTGHSQSASTLKILYKITLRLCV